MSRPYAKLTKRTFRVQMVLKSEKAPDFGMGKGVLAEQEVSYICTKKRRLGRRFWNDPLFIASLVERENQLVKDILKFTWKEI